MHDYPFDPTYGYDLDTLPAIPAPSAPGDLDEVWQALYGQALTNRLPGDTMRWRKIFRGTDDQVPQARQFVTGLLAGHPARDDAELCTAELASNAIRHTASGRGGFFVTEVSWTGTTIRVAVADAGADTEPLPRDPASDVPGETGYGLHLVAQLSTRSGTRGDRRGRVVWAEFSSRAGPPARPPLPEINPPLPALGHLLA